MPRFRDDAGRFRNPNKISLNEVKSFCKKTLYNWITTANDVLVLRFRDMMTTNAFVDYEWDRETIFYINFIFNTPPVQKKRRGPYLFFACRNCPVLREKTIYPNLLPWMGAASEFYAYRDPKDDYGIYIEYNCRDMRFVRNFRNCPERLQWLWTTKQNINDFTPEDLAVIESRKIRIGAGYDILL